MDKRDTYIRARVNDEERKEIEEVLKESGMSMTQLLKMSAKLYRIASRAGERIVDEALEEAREQNTGKRYYSPRASKKATGES